MADKTADRQKSDTPCLASFRLSLRDIKISVRIRLFQIRQSRAFDVGFGEERALVVGHFDSRQRDVLHVSHVQGMFAGALDVGE